MTEVPALQEKKERERARGMDVGWVNVIMNPTTINGIYTSTIMFCT